MRTGEKITYRQLWAAVREYASWVRLYQGYQGKEINSYMNRQAIAESVHAYGECYVIKAMPGYGFLFVWIDTKHRADEEQENGSEVTREDEND